MNYTDFCELAPLYVLDVLDQKERLLVEHYLAQVPESEADLEQLRDAAMAISYDAPELPLPDDLKTRLFEQIADQNVVQNHQSVTPPRLANDSPMFTVRAADLNWQPHRVPGVAIAILYEDPIRREIVCLLRAEAGVYYPSHRHASTEEIFMLEGDLVVDGQVYGVGDYIRSAHGTFHAPHTKTGCMFFIRTSLDNEILN
ncbi:MAG: cupin domain-containing protein [Coleofasciculaceae cyanobacterium]